MKLISVCIPTYEMHGKGAEFLRQSLDMLARQTFKDFDVVISDHSQDDAIEKLCATYAGKLDIHYFKNAEKRGNSSANINNAIRRATGKLIKIIFQDDFLYSADALNEIASHFDLASDGWLVTACTHTRDGSTFYRPFQPRYNDTIHIGKNTISSPSVLTIKNDAPLIFDEELIWHMDTDYYKRLYDRYGLPKIVSSIGAVNRVGEHQISSTVADARLRAKEYRYMLKKYDVKGAAGLIMKKKVAGYRDAAKSVIKKALGKK